MNNSTHINISEQLTKLSRKIRNRTVLLVMFQSFAFSSLFMAILFIVYRLIIEDCYQLTSAYSVTALTFSILILLIMFLYLSFRNNFFQLNISHLIEHLNRVQPAYQESAQLLLVDEKDLTLLQTLQSVRMLQIFDKDMREHGLKNYLPSIKQKRLRFSCLLLVSLFLIIVVENLPVEPRSHAVNEIQNNLQQSLQQTAPNIKDISINVVSPDYTNVTPYESKSANLKVIEGALVSWRFKFNQSQYDYFFISAREEPIQLKLLDDDWYSIDKLVSQSGIYRLAYRPLLDSSKQLTNIEEVFSIEVITDESPKIKIEEPKTRLHEISKTAKGEFLLQVLVSDDYALTKVNIVASVAKGSGESVKFRDHTFDFDKFTLNTQSLPNDTQETLQSESSRDSRIYYKQWMLSDLNMEPGDEVYFSVVAKDNKQPEAQQSKSSTIIVRWLDERVNEMALDGVKINFIPEYFRSQRQIIIETEQLVADKKELLPQQINDKSVDLGFSQRDLKEKFGQFLGDEFGEGPGEQVNEAGFEQANHSSDKEHQHEQQTGENSDAQIATTKTNTPSQAHRETHGHGGEHSQAPTATNDINQIIASFGHNHGSTEVVASSNKDPKSWMKKAVSEMWKAEMHLMLAEPEIALPFEYNAYHYLKLARQAERIYVKRLGFEPPPVSEETRLSGDLSDILEQAFSLQDSIDQDSEQQIIKNVYKIINRSNVQTRLSEKSLVSFQLLQNYLLEKSKTRTALIGYAATVERILLEKSLMLQNCSHCVTQLSEKLWQLINSTVSLPMSNSLTTYHQARALKDYSKSTEMLRKRAQTLSHADKQL